MNNNNFSSSIKKCLEQINKYQPGPNKGDLAMYILNDYRDNKYDNNEIHYVLKTYNKKWFEENGIEITIDELIECMNDMREIKKRFKTNLHSKLNNKHK